MTLFIVSFIAGALTVLAPCILPLLPIVLGGAATDVTDRTRPFRIVFWLSLSVFVFTFLLRASTVLIDIPPDFWKYFAATIIGLMGLTLMFPILWEKISTPFARVEASSNKLLAEGNVRRGIWGDILMGLALGPIFTTCSPTYFVILAAVLPESFTRGALYILVYVLGLALSLILIAFAGQNVLRKLNVAADPRGFVKRGVGVLFVVLAIFIATGYDKKLETAILDGGFFDITKVEQRISETLLSDEGTSSVITQEEEDEKNMIEDETDNGTSSTRTPQGPQYEEIVRPSGYVNSEPFLLKDVIGEKVILLDFMTYSCINCQRTFPYLNKWHELYQDEGLLIVGIHTPEFAFERKIENVEDAAKRFGLQFPLVLDNSYTTWTAYGNRFWPHKYLINIHGEIVYDHIGEGAYEETENRIVALLEERKQVLGEEGRVETKNVDNTIVSDINESRSPEVYFGAKRNGAYAGNAIAQRIYEDVFTVPQSRLKNIFYLGGGWRFEDEYVSNTVSAAELVFTFDARNMYMVAEGGDVGNVEVYIDGILYEGTEDVENGVLHVDGSRLYHVYTGDSGGEHTVRLKVIDGTVKLYTFTFG